MRKFLISLLLASAAASLALAAPNDENNNRDQARAERQQARSERQQARDQARSERQAERPSSSNLQQRPERQVNFQPQVQQQVFDRQAMDAARAQRQSDRQAERVERVQLRDQRIEQNRDDRMQRQAERIERNNVRRPVPVVSRVPREGTQPPPRFEGRPSVKPNWTTNWRNNSRYDWHNYRNRHRSLFHLGFYIDPFGWGYQPYSIGWRLWPSYYSSNYWLQDPWMYRLPYAPPGYRWIRYYDDALLVDTWNGEVVDVLYNFFW
jgi:hypothetical protein